MAVHKPKAYQKETAEERRYEFDFSEREEIKGGQTIDTVISCTFTPADSSLEILGNAIDPTGQIVQSLVDGGTDGTLYYLKCLVQLSDGETRLVANGELRVADLVAP